MGKRRDNHGPNAAPDDRGGEHRTSERDQLGPTVQEVMTSEVLEARSGCTVREAAQLMREHNVGFLPVCEPDGTVVGTLTDRDITLRVTAEGRSSGTVVEDVMSTEIIACHTTDNLQDIERLMRSNQVGRVLVLDEDNMVAGVLSLADLAQYENPCKVGEVMADITLREADPH